MSTPSASKSAGALVPEVVPAEVDPLELFAVPCGTLAAKLRFVPVREQPERLPRPLDVWLAGATLRAEHERLRPEGRSSLQDCRQSAVRIERDSSVLFVLRGRAGNPGARV
jgi:hypothetical protein